MTIPIGLLRGSHHHVRRSIGNIVGADLVRAPTPVDMCLINRIGNIFYRADLRRSHRMRIGDRIQMSIDFRMQPCACPGNVLVDDVAFYNIDVDFVVGIVFRDGHLRASGRKAVETQFDAAFLFIHPHS